MGAFDPQLSRISKLFLDRDHASADVALCKRKQFGVVLLCGADVGQSRTLQVAVLTAARIAVRCFPGAVRFVIEPQAASAPLLVWPGAGIAFSKAVEDLVGAGAALRPDEIGNSGRVIVFGNAPEPAGSLRVTFDGWIAKVGPTSSVKRLAEREFCSVTGVLAAALALSELFLSFAEISIQAGRRAVALSLWRPDLDARDPQAQGIPVEVLPDALWLLGLGHLGNAYLWTLGTLPYASPEKVRLMLFDFDKVEDVNVETGMLFGYDDVGQRKTRSCARWAESVGFQTRMIERPFDAAFRRRADEPGLAFCGFDSNEARRDLGAAGFLRVVESGLGGTPGNFETISVHTLPNSRPPAELWPELTEEEKEMLRKGQERTANENAAYLGLSKDACGRFDLAGKSVAVPFVGAAAAAIVVAEAIRLLHGGPAYSDMRLRLGTPSERSAIMVGNYSASDVAGLTFCDAQR